MVPAINDIRIDPETITDILYRIASKRKERAAAFHLVYNSYLRAGLGDMNRYQMRVTPYHLLEGTEIFVAECRGQAAFTMTLVMDGELGIPMESVYGDEVDRLRQRGLRVGEVSCLADRHSHLRGPFPVFLRLSRLMVQYARYRGLDALLAAVHPKHARFYRRCMDFRAFGEEKTYPMVRNHPAVALGLEFARVDREPPECYDFFFGEQIPLNDLQPQPISRDDREHFSPMVDPSFQFVPLGDTDNCVPVQETESLLYVA